MVQLIGKLEEIKKKNKSMGLGTSCFQVMTLWRGGWPFLFSIRQISCQKLLCQTVANVGVKRFHIVTHSYAASILIKTFFVKLTTFSSAKITKKETKPKYNSESISKIKIRPDWTFFKILLILAYIAYNICI